MRAMEVRYEERFSQSDRGATQDTAADRGGVLDPYPSGSGGAHSTGGETYLYRFDYPRAKGPLAGEVPHTAGVEVRLGQIQTGTPGA